MGRCSKSRARDWSRRLTMAYQQMAALYDQLMIDAPYDQWATFTQDVIDRSGKNINTIIDLGCGTGEITTRLAQSGYQLSGVDYSSDMLTYAEAKASAVNQSIKWIHQDLRELSGFENMDAAISYCDVVNYLTSENDLRLAFNRIEASLKPGGLFIFDVHSLKYVKEKLINRVFTEVTDDVCYIWNCEQGDETGEMYHDLTFFSSDGSLKYDRFEEYHHQKTYSVEFYSQLLIECGFEKPIVYRDFSLKNEFSSEEAERIFIVTEKRSR